MHVPFSRALWITAGLALSLIVLRIALAQRPVDRKLPVLQTHGSAVFDIPFTIDPRTSAVEVQLHFSYERGRWQLYSKAKPEEGRFKFRAPRDGEYWFMVRTQDKSGRLLPEREAFPEMRVLVDTVPPTIELTARRGAAGEVIASWRIIDRSLRPETLKVEYRSVESSAMQPLAVDPPKPDPSGEFYFGEATWIPSPATDGPIVVRAQIVDNAGNIADAETETSARGEHIVSTARTLPASKPWDAAPTGATFAGVMENDPQAPPPFESFGGAHRFTAAREPQYPSTPFGPASTASSYTEEIPTPPADPRLDDAEEISAPALSGPIIPTSKGDGFPTFENTPAPSPDRTSTFDESLPQGMKPRMVNSRRFELEYEIEAIGPSGISKIELWGTSDGGATWRSYAIDSDNRSPMTVNVEGEGVYGFVMTVESGNGMRGAPPRPGDTPDVWIGVDLTPPVARLTTAEQGRDETLGKLIIRWEASDERLEPRPISLYYSETPDGPWTTIAAGLANNGHYQWSLDSRVPDMIYLRLEVRDEAGNVTRVDSNSPLRLDRIRPRSRIRGVRSLDESARAPQRIFNLR